MADTVNTITAQLQGELTQRLDLVLREFQIERQPQLAQLGDVMAASMVQDVLTNLVNRAAQRVKEATEAADGPTSTAEQPAPDAGPDDRTAGGSGTRT